MKKFLTAMLIASCIALTGGVLSACDGENSAYEDYRESYIAANGSEEGLLSEVEWQEFLKNVGKNPQKSIVKIETVCGEYRITYTDGSVEFAPAASDAGHAWDAGTVTTEATCTTAGVVTYHCEDCNAIRKEPIDAGGDHVYTAYYRNNTKFHWKECSLCGEISGGGSRTRAIGMDDL